MSAQLQLDQQTSPVVDDRRVIHEENEPSPAQLVYVVRREGLSSVFMSQVVTRLTSIAEAGIPVDIMVLTPPGCWLRRNLRQRWREVVAALPCSLADRLWRLPSFPSRIDWPRVEARFLTWWLRTKFQPQGKPLLLQCRNATVTNMALWARRVLPASRVIFDCRGVLDREVLYRHNVTYESAPPELRQEAMRLHHEQCNAARESDAVFCVSEEMANYLVEQYGISRNKCVVVPCCVDVGHFEDTVGHRDQVRKELGLVNRFVATYCGSLARYQLPQQSLRLFLRIQARRPNAHFLGITTEPAKLIRDGRNAGLSENDMTVISVPHAEVARYLSAADCGFLLREASPVNRVASPVKFGEYLASGTPVILSEGIGDYSELARRERVGLVLPDDSDESHVDAALTQFLDDYQHVPELWRCRCRRVAKEHLDANVHLAKVLEAYRRLKEK